MLTRPFTLLFAMILGMIAPAFGVHGAMSGNFDIQKMIEVPKKAAEIADESTRPTQNDPCTDEQTGCETNPGMPFARIQCDDCKGPWKTEWSMAIINSIEKFGPFLLRKRIPESDLSLLACTGYSKAPATAKKAFWALLFASMAKYESNYDIDSSYYEKKLTKKHKRQITSRGLLQLSYGDEKNHPGCPLDRNTDNIEDPVSNLQCGLAIMSDQLEQRGTIFTPKKNPYYWSVLSKSKTRTGIQNFFKRHVVQLPFCKK